ncbi:MAG: HAD family hydrolase [Acidobacteria bacterium]|nr:HAD family hydrolase [Acidobacteriota bacterium]
MKLSAFALDFDGTLTFDGRLPSPVAEAIADARRHGIVMVLATGRRLDDLHACAGELTIFDAIVGENGAVLEFPARGRRAVLARPPAPVFLEQLTQRGVPFVVGSSIVETDGGAAPVVLEVLHRLQLPLVLAFNRGRLMILPPAIAKSTGLREALRSIRVSLHNTIAIGDAENDHDMLDACEVGVAVGWGSAALKAVADEVVEGRGPDAVARYIQRASRQTRLSAAQMGRRSMLLGHRTNRAELRLALRGRTILIGGEPGSGKSALAGLLCEQLILQGYCVCVLDAEGDFVSLRTLPGVVVLGGEDALPTARELTRTLEYPDVSVVIDLSKTPHRDKVTYVRGVLPLLNTLRRRTGLPHKILLDEAHYFLWAGSVNHLIDPELAGYIIVTYRLSTISPDARLPQDTVAILRRESDAHEVQALAAMCCPASGQALPKSLVARLGPEEAVLLPGADEAHGEVVRFTVAPRLTEHVRHRSKYLDMPIADAQAFVFGEGPRARPHARTMKEFMSLLGSQPPAGLQGHLRRHDFSRWIEHVFRDGPLAARVRGIEDWSERDDMARDAAEAISQAIRARYEPPVEPFARTRSTA